MSNSRREAAFALMRWLATKEFPSRLLANVDDRPFVQDLFYTAVRRLRALRFILGKFVAKWPKGELEALLYIGAAQLLYMDGVPDFAAVNETVAASRLSSNPSVSKVVNGVLRNMIRKRAEIESALAEAPVEVRESFPTALFRRWSCKFGPERAAALCESFNIPAGTFLARRDTSFTRLERGVKVEDVAGYANGDFIVQDPATAGAVELAGVSPGEEVLDFCAAPGGKCVQLAWRGAKVTACEVNPARRRVLAENISRTKVDAEIIASPDDLPPGRLFDAVLVDAPCSNTGVLRRRPDARWNWTESKLASLVEMQNSILARAAHFVKPGGRLVYSTCSIEDEENSGVVSGFLSSNAGFAFVDERVSLPFSGEHDGAYAALLVKSAGDAQDVWPALSGFLDLVQLADHPGDMVAWRHFALTALGRALYADGIPDAKEISCEMCALFASRGLAGGFRQIAEKAGLGFSDPRVASSFSAMLERASVFEATRGPAAKLSDFIV